MWDREMRIGERIRQMRDENRRPDDSPIALKRLFEGDSFDAKHFEAHVRQYKNAFAFAAIKSTQLQFANRAPPVYCISRKIVHFYDALRPKPLFPNYTSSMKLNLSAQEEKLFVVF